jgi:hypothetical protein
MGTFPFKIGDPLTVKKPSLKRAAGILKVPIQLGFGQGSLARERR